MKILNFGSLNIDYVYDVDNFVRPGETITSLNLNKFCGGKGLNQSIALAKSGAEVYHAGSVGAADGQMLIDELEKNNVSTKYIMEKDCSTGHAIIQVNSNGQNCIIIFGGANQTIEKNHIDNVLRDFNEGDFIILQNEINNISYIIEKAHQRKMKIVLNPSPMNAHIMKLPLEFVDYFMVNELEAEDISGEREKERILQTLGNKFPNAHIVMTLGKEGVIYKHRNTILKHGIYKVPVVDTTAAGDTFTGFFIGSIAQGASCEEALRIASVASSISVSRKGAATSIPTINEVESNQLKLED